MFDRLRSGYYLLFVLVTVQFVLVFPIGNADLALYLSLQGLTRNLIPAWSLFPLLWAFGIGIVLVRRRVDRPLRAMRTMLFTNRKWLIRCSILAVLIITYTRTLTSYKTLIPQFVPYWADPHLIDFDIWLFGTDPWRITHALFGPFGTMVLDRLYSLWFMVLMLCLGWFCFTRNPKLQVRGLLSAFLSWSVLGILAATAFSSVGPCFYERFYGDPHFAPLMAELHAADRQHNLLAIGTMNWLLAMFGKDQFGAGISAMPSLHVTIATMCFLACYSYGGRRWLTVLSGLFAAAIFVGSVHLGWHYASDGLFGMVAVTVIWWLTGRFVDYLDARDQARQRAGIRFLPATA